MHVCGQQVLPAAGGASASDIGWTMSSSAGSGSSSQRKKKTSSSSSLPGAANGGGVADTSGTGTSLAGGAGASGGSSGADSLLAGGASTSGGASQGSGPDPASSQLSTDGLAVVSLSGPGSTALGSVQGTTRGSILPQSIPGMDSSTSGGNPGAAARSSTPQSIPGVDPSATGDVQGDATVSETPQSILGMGSSADAGSARQLLRHVAVPPAKTARRLLQGDPRVDQFSYGGYGGAVNGAPGGIRTGMLATGLGRVGGAMPGIGRRLAQKGPDPAIIPGTMLSIDLGQAGGAASDNRQAFAQTGFNPLLVPNKVLPSVPGLPDFSPFRQVSAAHPTSKGSYGSPPARRRLSAATSSKFASLWLPMPIVQHHELPEATHPNPVPISQSEGNTLRRRRRAKPESRPNPNPASDPDADGPLQTRRLAQFVPLHGGAGGGAISGVVVPGLFRPNGSYNRRR